MGLILFGKQEKTYEPRNLPAASSGEYHHVRFKKSKEPLEPPISPVFYRRTPAGTVGEPVFFQVGPPTTAINALFSHSGFSLDPTTVLFPPFLISDAVKN